MTINPGDIVISAAGRDAGKSFVVLYAIDEQFVLISDGGLRKVSKPKKKKIKHLIITKEKSQVLADKLKRGEMVTHKELKKALREFKNGTEAI